MQARVARATGMGRLADAMFLPLAEKMLVKARDEKLVRTNELCRRNMVQSVIIRAKSGRKRTCSTRRERETERQTERDSETDRETEDKSAS